MSIKFIDGKDSKITETINKLGDGISRFSAFADNVKDNRIEVGAMILFSVLHFIISYYHEPWFDEAEAWQIARCASIRDIIFEIPHLEGHSPMWDFILMPWARLGAPYELSLAIISFLFIGIAAALIIWKAPWPRLIRVLVPFTYFFMYQYGVICRPYCVITCLLMCIAYLYQTKDEKPGRFVICLALLVYIHAYGLLIAGGIAIVWLIEMCEGKNVYQYTKGLIKDKRAWMLLGLLVVALLTIAQIMPRGNTYGATINYARNNLLIRALYTFFAIPVDTTLTNIWSDYYGLEGTYFVWSEYWFACALGIAFWVWAIMYGRKKKTCLLLIIPYSLFALFAAIKYISMHHIGVGLMVVICWLWISAGRQNVNELNDDGRNKKEYKLFASVGKIFLTLIILSSLSWSIFAMVTDVRYIYTFGKEEARFIKEHNLDQYTIMAEWQVTRYEGSDDIALYDFNGCYYACNTLPYFERNIYYNLNEGRDDKAYVIHEVNSYEDDLEYIQNTRIQIPQVLIGEPELNMIYEDNELTLEDDYILIYHNYSLEPWKNGMGLGEHKIYMLNDLAESLGYEEIR